MQKMDFVQVLSLTLADLGGVGEGVFHTLADMAGSFDTISAPPGHEGNLAVPDLAALGGDGVAEGENYCFGYQAVALGMSFRDLVRTCAQSVAMETRPSRTAVMRRIALSSFWRAICLLTAVGLIASWPVAQSPVDSHFKFGGDITGLG
jgi:hypothetical protein